MRLDRELIWLGAGVVALLVVSSAVGWVLARRTRTDTGRATVANMNARIRAWWVMAVVFFGALAGGRVGITALFLVLSFLALREFVTLTPTRRGDHRALFWVFFVITPAQYWLVVTSWYGMLTIFIPVYAFLFLPLRVALAGDCERFLERAAKTQWGVDGLRVLPEPRSCAV